MLACGVLAFFMEANDIPARRGEVLIPEPQDGAVGIGTADASPITGEL